MAKHRKDYEGTIRKKSPNCWEVRISGAIDFATGKPVRIIRYAPTEKEAIQLLHQLQHAMENNNYHASQITLGEWLDLWLETYMKTTLKRSTYNSYASYAKNHFKPALGSIRLEDLTTRTLQQFYNYKIETEHLAPKTIRNLNLYLHKALSQAQREGLISYNPAGGVNIPHTARPKIVVLTRDQQYLLIRASYQHRYGVFIRLDLMTGLRLGELLGLRWVDIDFRASVLHVNQTLNRLQIPNLPDNYDGPRTEIVIQAPKSENSARAIPLLPQAIQDLMRWRKVQEADKQTAGDLYHDSGFIVTNPLGGFIEPRTFKDYYNQILKLAGLPHVTFHALRHTFATRAVEQGMDEKTLSTILGHASTSFTMDTYTHVLDDHKQEEMKLMEDLFDPAQFTNQVSSYPILVTATPAGYLFSLPDFPTIQLTASAVEDGIRQVTDRLHEELATNFFPPNASQLTEIELAPGQFVVQCVL
ncbi:MAG: tyrosine-type recombinase/integrase [Clostridiales bacterium]|nr:tyrosine-type recombinase/integrase [Clostridiales bacterium]